jgi:hypothetical protein
MQNELIDTNAWRKPQLTVSGVMAVWLQNFGGGVGGAVIVGVIAWQFGADWASALRWSVIVGGLLFGALMIMRSAIDEIVDAMDYRAMIADMDALEAQIVEERGAHEEELEAAQNLLRAVQHDLNVARSENWARTAGPRAHPAVDLADAPVQPDPARDDAQKLLERAYSNRNWGKDAMRTECNMTSTRREAAIDLLVRRGIATRGNKQTYLNPANLSDALTKLLGDKKI